MADTRILAQETSVGRATSGPTTWVPARGDRSGVPFSGSRLEALALEGKVFISSDADQNDVVTGQTSFANTTPTFLLNVPTGTTCQPLNVKLSQAGVVAGAAIDILFEIDNIAAYASGGTAETILSTRAVAADTASCALYTGATATAGYGVMVDHIFQVVQDVASALTDIYQYHEIDWTPPVPLMLQGPASFKVFTYAGTTGPSWLWSIGWAEWPSP